MTAKCTISVVTPSLNQAGYLPETLESVLTQEGRGESFELEFVVCDGGSSDGSAEILREYGPKLAWWCSESDRGQSHAINKGFAHSTGDVCCYLNSDDLFLPGALQAAAEFFRGRSDRPLITSFGGRMFGGKNGDVTELPPDEPSLMEWMDTPRSLFQPATFWTRTLMNEIGPFREDLHFCMDKEFFLRAIFGVGAYVRGSDRIVAAFREHADQKSSSIWDRCLAENRLLKEEYSAKEPYRDLLRKEHVASQLKHLQQFEADRHPLRSRLRYLAGTVRRTPSVVTQTGFAAAVSHIVRPQAPPT